MYTLYRDQRIPLPRPQPFGNDQADSQSGRKRTRQRSGVPGNSPLGRLNLPRKNLLGVSLVKDYVPPCHQHASVYNAGSVYIEIDGLCDMPGCGPTTRRGEEGNRLFRLDEFLQGRKILRKGTEEIREE